MCWRRSACLGILLLILSVCPAQQPTTVNQDIFDSHVIKRTELIYPPIAKAARITGTVVVDVQVGVDGKIASTKVVSGPAMLQQAALDCVRHWTLKPFEKDGATVVTTGRTSIVFSLGKEDPTAQEEKLAQQYFPLSDACHAKSRSTGDWQEAARACKDAAQIAEQFPVDRRFIEKRSAYVYAAWALMMSGDLKEARRYADLAVEVVKLGQDDNSGSNAAYSARGVVEGKSGEFGAADQDLSTAEEFERKAIEWAKGEKFEHLDSYTFALVQDLRIHAQVLQAMGRADDAQKKTDEAAAVK
jgi:TonB family protein